jgi:hypothetical protein
MTEHLTSQQTTERWLFRLGAIAAVVGSLVSGVGNLFHPATPLNPEGVAQVVIDSGRWVPVHIIIILGIIVMLGGLLGIYHSIKGGVAGALARFGLFAAVAGSTLGVILITLDGVALKQLAEEWARTPQRSDTVLQLVLAMRTIDFALVSFLNVLYAGITFILYGLAVSFSDVYPRWLGWVAVAAGVASVWVGVSQALVGESTPFSQMMGIVSPSLVTLWVLVMGILLARKAGRVGNNIHARVRESRV